MTTSTVSLLMPAALAAALLVNHVSNQAASQKISWALKFSDYAETNVFHGTPARPVLTTSRQRTFRTKIREAAAKGPNFAGHFTVAEWGCGSGCASFEIVDAITGKAFDPPFKTLAMPFVAGGRDYQGLVYRLDSRLLILDGCPEEDEQKCGTYYYAWEKGELKLLPFDPQPIPK